MRAFQKHGFIYASEVTIWKDPVTAMQRTKALGLLHKTVRTNATMCRQGIPDYLVTMRAHGEVQDKVAHGGDIPVDEWQKIASPVWMDINPSDTLQFKSAREHDDERHICPLQLGVIRRGIRLWTAPGDVVLTPFLGIGSEAYCAVEMGRKAIGVELKKSYFDQAVKNLDALAAQHDMFATA
ncbi:DNA methylase [compost metagenome]